MTIPALAFRFKTSATVAIEEHGRYRLRELPAGAVFRPEKRSKPTSSCMLDGTCNGAHVSVFTRDLDERAEAISGDDTVRSHNQLRELRYALTHS